MLYKCGFYINLNIIIKREESEMKKIFAVMLVFTLLTTLFSFNVVEAKSKTVTLIGEIIKVSLEKASKSSGELALKCEDKTYNLAGFTVGMQKYLNSTAKVIGTTSKNSQGTLVLKVKSYKIISKSKPTPEPVVTQPPKTIQLEGTLFNKDSNASRFLLKTESTTYELIGNTEGMEKVYGSILLVEGNYVQTLLPTEFPLFSVISYKVIKDAPQPTPVVTQPKTMQLKGTLFTKDSNASRFFLKTESTTYELIGNTEGMEKVCGSILLVEGNYVQTLLPTEFPLFSVISYKVIKDAPQPTPVVTQLPKAIQLEGTLFTKDSNEPRFLLKTKSTTYELIGNTEGMEKVCGKVLLVEGNYVYTLVATEFPLFSVTSYKVIKDVPQPTPVVTPITVKNITMADNGGYVYVKTGDEVKLELESNPTTGYDWSYITKPDQNVLLETNYDYIPDDASGKLVGSGGKGVWTYKALKSDTVVIEMAYSRSWESTPPNKTFIVKVIVQDVPQPTPTPVDYQTIKGSLSVTKLPAAESKELNGWTYTFSLKTQSGDVSLSGNTKGLEMYSGFDVEVTGNYSPLTIYPPIFVVESYKVIPKTTIACKTHTIISDKALYVSMPDTSFTEATGYTTISWTEGTQNAFYSSKLNVGKDVYEFQLVSAKISYSQEITGLFNILKNGEVIMKEIPGQLYGLTEPVGSYFKFCSEDNKWHMSAYITNRLDF